MQFFCFVKMVQAGEAAAKTDRRRREDLSSKRVLGDHAC